MPPLKRKRIVDTSPIDPNAQSQLQSQSQPPQPKKVRLSKGRQVELEDTPSASFVTCHLNRELTDTLLFSLSKAGLDSIHYSEHTPEGRKKIEDVMRARGMWEKSRASTDPLNFSEGGKHAVPAKLPPSISSSTEPTATPNQSNVPVQENSHTPNFSSTRRQSQRRHRPSKRRTVSIDPNNPLVYHYSYYPNATDTDNVTSESTALTCDKAERGGTDKQDEMSQPHRPSLKLKLSTNNVHSTPTPSGADASAPNPQSAVRTPSIKLNFGKKPSISTTSTPAIKNDASKSAAPSTGKKRKRTKADDGSEDELSKAPPPPPQRRLTLKTNVAPAKTPATPGPVFRLKTKGKIPKRPAGVGYDSELEDKELDPVILEGFILRMQPGPDCDYVQTAIRDGTIGTHRAQGGADIRMRFLDTNGRRGIMIVNGHQYATTIVDLPCIIEGMKSWDKKAWIKSIDICQMMIVLGTCASDEEAKNYPLPPDVDPKTFAYAHGVTAPMKWVRKRRFARTRRARVDDIESIERKVNALLEADAKALSSSFRVSDHDPRVEYSEVEDEYDDEQDAEGEDEDGYFPRQDSVMAQTPVAMDTHVDQDQIDELEAMFNDDDGDEGVAPTTNGHLGPKATSSGLHPPEADSSVAVTSASASPSASVANTAAATPAGDLNQASSDDDDDEDDDASDKSDSEKDADDNLQQVKDRIADMETKIREQTELLKRTSNAIVKKKLARKIGELRDDVRMMRVQNGLGAEDDGEDGDE